MFDISLQCTVYDSMEGNPLFRTSDCILFSNAEEKSGYH